ncbi:sigma-70 family RNA polymerase sigma factor [Rufibacter latericius]|uniref:Sigma-70 family RNA polymerase sigma factor n=1 Tax=Rufibacter latericius TaxID=2487040 RepID=A0A3M9MI78_9BACT|nr:sigma-70 family RNA polymerase sigma factor [Rufibacter latericius]RNI24533.1 sigma-70 family RNA polymerase sigma factor [Rufibacter latericius]
MGKRETLVAATIPDQEIILRVLEGEKDLYAVLVRRNNQRLYRIGMSILDDEEEVEEMMQTAFVKAYEHLHTFAYKSAFSTWLTRILINECLLRAKKRKLACAMSDENVDREVNLRSAEHIPTPLTKLLSSELHVVLEEAIRQLPEKYRTVFVMREIEEMNVAETMLCLDLTEANVKVRLNRAKALLRKSLSHLYKKEDILHFHLSKCDRITENVMKRIASL